jgi:hypothetical protein
MKKITWLFSVLMIVFGISACGASAEIDHQISEEEQNSIILTADGIPERKIIYTVDGSYDVNDLNQSIITLRSLINSDEWFDSERIYTTSAHFTARVKTDRLDTFIEALNDHFQVRSFSKMGQDISLQYQDKTNKITSLNLQITRLQALYEEASLAEMITINQQLSNLEVELMNLQGELNVYDSLIEYSEVHIRLNGSSIVTRSPFINRLGNGFVNGFKSVITLVDGLLIAIANIIPFVIIFGPIGYGGYLLRRKYRARKKLKRESQKTKGDV